MLSFSIRVTRSHFAPRPASRQNFPHHIPGHIRQSEIPPTIPVSQFRVIHPQRMKHRGVQIMNMNGVLHRLEAELVRIAVSDAAFDAAASQQRREAVAVVIAAILYFHQAARRR